MRADRFQIILVAAAVVFASWATATATSYTWNTDSAGNWNDDSKWSGTGYPNAVGDAAYFNYDITAPRTVNVNGAYTIGYLWFKDIDGATSAGFSLSGTGTLILDSSSSPFYLSASYASYNPGPVTHSVNCNMTVKDNISSDVSGTNTVLQIAGDLIQSGATPLLFKKTNYGTLVFTSACNNTMTGGFEIAGGTVSIASDANLGAAPASYDADALYINGNHTFKTTATTTINANRGIKIIGSEGVFEVASGTTLTVNSHLTGGGTFNKYGDGDLYLKGTGSDFTGWMHVYDGTLSFDNTTALGNDSSQSISLDNGTTFRARSTTSWASGKTLNLTGGTATISVAPSQTLTLGNRVIGSGGLTKGDSGILTLSSTSNAWTGNTVVQAGTLRLGASNVLPNTTEVSLQGSAVLDLNGKSDAVQLVSGGTSNQIIVGAGGGLSMGAGNDSWSFSGLLSYASGSVSKSGSGTFTWQPSTAAGSSYGVVSLSGGTMAVNSNTFYTDTTLNISGGTLNMTAGNVTVDALMQGSSNSIQMGSRSLTVGANNANSSMSGTTTGTGALVKSGTGRLTLNNANVTTGGLNAVGGLTFTGAGNINTFNGNVYLADAAGSSVDVDVLDGIVYVSDPAHSLIFGRYGDALVDQSGGTLKPVNFVLADMAGSECDYTMTGGDIGATGYSCIGDEGMATLTQTGGTHDSANMTVGWSSSGVGEYRIEGSSAKLTADEVNIGLYGRGLLAQTAGTVEIGGPLRIGRYAGSMGAYYYYGGQLNGAGSMVVRDNATAVGLFQGHGVVGLTGDLTNNGRIIADSGTLDLTAMEHVLSGIANYSNNGWYADNLGRLVLPDVAVAAGSGAYNWGEDAGDADIDLVNSVRADITSADGGSVTVSIYDPARGDVPAGLINPVGVWYFDEDFYFGSADLTFRYDDLLAASLGLVEEDLQLVHYVKNAWRPVMTGIDAADNLIYGVAPSFSFFAVAGDFEGVDVPEPLSLVFFGTGITGVFGFAVRRSKTRLLAQRGPQGAKSKGVGAE